MKIIKTIACFLGKSNLHQVINSQTLEVLFEGTEESCEKYMFEKISEEEHELYYSCIHNNNNFN